MNQPNILIVDDHEDIRELVQRFLSQHGFKTTTAENAEEMRKCMEKENFQLLVLDVMMPGEDGLSVCRNLRSAGNNIPIIMLTAMSEDTDLIVGLELGADDYITKPFNPRELLARIKAVLRRSELNEENVKPSTIKYYHFNGWTLDIRKRELINPTGSCISISTAEFELLSTFMQHPNETLSRDQLLDLARGREAQVFDRSIDTLISRLRRKLNSVANDDIEFIKTVWGGGYCFIGDVTCEKS